MNVFPARAINNRGQMIAFANTNFLTQIASNRAAISSTAFCGNPTGKSSTCRFLPGSIPNNNSLVGDLTSNGLMAGFVSNGLTDPSRRGSPGPIAESDWSSAVTSFRLVELVVVGL
ncbi:MAG: hypothetical protein ABIU29_00900 [Chthoniobacterales bacterium]